MSRFSGASMRYVALHVAGVALLFAGIGVAAITAHGLMNYRAAVDRHGGATMDLGSDARPQSGQYGHMARIVGTPSVAKPPGDHEFGLKADTPVLVRHVEMFQWRELRFGADVSYELAWVDRLVDASRFRQPQGHANPVRFPLSEKQFDAALVQLGGFRLSPELAHALPGSSIVAPDLTSLPPNLAASFSAYQPYLTTSAQPGSPRLGDVRVSWSDIPLQQVTVFARIDGDRLVPAADAVDGKRYVIEVGDVALPDMISGLPIPPDYAMARQIASVLLASLGAFAMLLACNRHDLHRHASLLALGLGALVVGAVSTLLWLGNDTGTMVAWLLVTALGMAVVAWRLQWHKRRAADKR